MERRALPPCPPAPSPGGASVRIRGLEHEYGSKVNLVKLPFSVARWPDGEGFKVQDYEYGDSSMVVLDRDALSGYRRRTVGFVFQHFGLVQVLTARENLELALSLTGVPRAARAARADALLAEVGLEGRAGHRPGELSGGEQQRVAIARALAHRPRLLLADEPTGNLDEEASAMVLELLERLRAESGCTLVVVTHNPAVAARAPRRARLDDGMVRIA